MRYAGTRTAANIKYISLPSRTKTGFNGWINQNLEVVQEPNVYLPGFTRPVATMLVPTSGDGKELPKGGYPDHLLIWQAVEGNGTSGNRMAAEVKTFWAFDDEDMEDLVSGESADPGTGEVHCLGDGNLGDLLLQVRDHILMHFHISNLFHRSSGANVTSSMSTMASQPTVVLYGFSSRPVPTNSASPN